MVVPQFLEVAHVEQRLPAAPLRDEEKNPILLLGGDKKGADRFYETMIPACERIWDDYLREQVAGLHKKD